MLRNPTLRAVLAVLCVLALVAAFVPAQAIADGTTGTGGPDQSPSSCTTSSSDLLVPTLGSSLLLIYDLLVL